MSLDEANSLNMIHRQNGYSILIADDSQAIMDGFREILKDNENFHPVGSAMNGKEAVEMTLGSDVDCVLMDLNMPVLNGYDAAKFIKQQKPAVRIIMMSTSIAEPELLKLLLVGVDGFMLKDAAITELSIAIATVMRHEKYLAPALSDRYIRQRGLQNKLQDSMHFTAKEKEIMSCMLCGMKISRIAGKLALRTETIAAYQKNILAKLGSNKN